MTSDPGVTRQDSASASQRQEALDELQQMQEAPRVVTPAEERAPLEREIRGRTDRLSSLLLGLHLQHSLDAEDCKGEQDLLVTQWRKPLKHDGRVQVWVPTVAGHRVPRWVPYYRRQGQRRRGKREAGLYAGLVLLGIDDRCTPALAAQMSLLAAMLGAWDEARDVLAQRGVALDSNTLRLSASRQAAGARVVQQMESTEFDDTVSGRRVVIGTDGGRRRLRETTRGPQTKKGRRRYTGAWREPKGLIIYVVDAEGQREASFAPMIDATLKGPEAVFALLRSQWHRLEITQAEPVLFIADGAPWIWKRVPVLVQVLALSTEQVHEVLDFYHAAEHLGNVSALRKDWSAKVRSRWRNQPRRWLLAGEVERLIAAVRDICRGRNSQASGTPRDYFIKNHSRMAQAKLMAMKLPIGSGAIESTVRRVVNLRLKGARLLWCRASAEAILLLRSYYKAGRWNLLKHMATSHLALLET